MKLVYCEKCGFCEEVEAVLFTKCKRCGTPLIVDDIEADEGITGVIDIEAVKEFEKTQQKQLKKIYDRVYYKKDHKKFEKMGKITDDEVANFLIDLWRK